MSFKSIDLKGGEYMIKKAGLAAGVFGISLFSLVTMTFAQTTTSTPSPTTTTTTVTPSPTTVPSSTVPSGAPATGRAN